MLVDINKGVNMKEYKIGDIVNESEYTDAAVWCNANNAKMDELEPDENGRRFQIVEIPEPLPPTYDEVKQLRKQYRQQHIDDNTAERSRRMANSSWTEEDERAYLALDAEVTAWIEENLPYPVGEEDA